MSLKARRCHRTFFGSAPQFSHWIRGLGCCVLWLILAGSTIALADNQWPALAGRIGPYGGISTIEEAEKLSADGFTLTLPSSYAPELLATLRAHRIAYIDAYFWELIRQTCLAQNELKKTASQTPDCEISDLEREAIASQARKHLEQIAGDTNVAGFWTLDDYPGSISTTLKMLHDLVAHANSAANLQRPTICGVGGNLDVNKSRDRSFINLALTNISPDACDLVSPYLYAVDRKNNPKVVDWSMRKTLPYLHRALKQKGFNMSSPLLVPILHAFSSASGYVMPRPEDIVAQVKAYSKERPIAFLFFTWQSEDADQGYSNNAVIRDGVQQGAAYLRTRFTIPKN
jgi:hypothetical protein